MQKPGGRAGLSSILLLNEKVISQFNKSQTNPRGHQTLKHIDAKIERLQSEGWNIDKEQIKTKGNPSN